MTIEFLDPTHEGGSSGFQLAGRITSLKGATVAIVSNGKRNTKPFFDAIADELQANHGVAKVVRITKSNYSAPVEPDLLKEAEKWQALISGVGD
ncbi:MAG: hypothetical protein AAGD43_20215 [Pseudomonadota bacterium]